jgi:hypothetical protein
MTNKTLTLVLAVLFGATMGVSEMIYAQNEEEISVMKAASSLNEQAQTPEGEQEVVQKLAAQYQVDGQKIKDLRSQDMGYGEVSIVLSLAGQLPGGINDENIRKVTDLRSADPSKGWGDVADELNVNLGKAMLDIKKTQAIQPLSKHQNSSSFEIPSQAKGLKK